MSFGSAGATVVCYSSRSYAVLLSTHCSIRLLHCSCLMTAPIPLPLTWLPRLNRLSAPSCHSICCGKSCAVVPRLSDMCCWHPQGDLVPIPIPLPLVPIPMSMPLPLVPTEQGRGELRNLRESGAFAFCAWCVACSVCGVSRFNLTPYPYLSALCV